MRLAGAQLPAARDAPVEQIDVSHFLSFNLPMKSFALAFALTLSFAVPATAGFGEGLAAYRRGELSKALRELKPLAENGHAEAQYWLAHMYIRGHGAPQDYTAAAKWYRRAAEQGYPKAQYSLGGLYAFGKGVPKDHAKAVEWYGRAADQGVTIAQLKLARRYQRGHGVLRDPVRAYKWFAIVVAGDAIDADKKLANKYLDRLTEKMTPAQIDEANQLVGQWTEGR